MSYNEELNSNNEELRDILETINELPDGNTVSLELDTTLKEAGKAADAKAVGDALANKADTSDIVQIDTSLTKQGQAAEAKATGLRLTAVEDWIEDTGSQHATRTDLSNHNTDTTAHNDMRIELKALSNRVNAALDSDDETLDQFSEMIGAINDNKTIIEQITTSKVNVADIINNLATNVINKPLSAAQGVALKSLIDAITVPTRVSQLSNDAQYVTETGLSGKGETWTFKLKDGSTVTKKVVLA